MEAQAGERVFRVQLLGSADSDGSQERGEDMRVLWGLEGLGGKAVGFLECLLH